MESDTDVTRKTGDPAAKAPPCAKSAEKLCEEAFLSRSEPCGSPCAADTAAWD